MNIFVGNLPFAATEEDVKKLFEGFGAVSSVIIVMSKEKKAPKSRGFGFVEMPEEAQALTAIQELNQKEFMGRPLNISPARPKPEPGQLKEKKIEARFKAMEEAEIALHKEKERKKYLASQVVNEPGTYRGGRRTRSFVKNRKSGPKPWEKSAVKPPWKKSAGGSQPWKKPEERSAAWKKGSSHSRPWKKAEEKPVPWKKTNQEARPWDKAPKPKPWERKTQESKPWGKSSKPRESGSTPSASGPRKYSKPPRPMPKKRGGFKKRS